MIAFLGDIHGDVRVLSRAYLTAQELGCEALIQVGDFGWCAAMEKALREAPWLGDMPVYAIDGNHEDFDWMDGLRLNSRPAPWRVGRSVYHVGRGDLLEIGGIRIGFMGGAGSIDKKWRVSDDKISGHKSWFWQEEITDEQLARADAWGQVDLLVTHTPPRSIINAYFDPRQKLMFDVPITWQDESSGKIDQLWERLGYPPIICGHMHAPVNARPMLKGIGGLEPVTETGEVKILDVNEMLFLDPGRGSVRARMKARIVDGYTELYWEPQKP